ncbi:ABC transporter substrate-binding protein [Ralstonia pseudosolanacearum]|uniref:ABC transporter substrate-binding protein n=1 Tax=Ralstonia pseudosolanacearum TaxID=1310165 RepID=UPI0006BC3375|nr:ABC transporter substrate-binding protein [Ralstonia pseudosolanacearum]AKZ26071.1 ABC transporter substrate-binding protein [Ralstonia solanacearum]BCL91826.1 ABC transporter substrate-binding protein [Ralstonia solanacearum]BCL97851.1 ABC transporter substrate-binding protein [Ralstonia solanacearum]BCM13293.1 ABC transporter substrate-binding protein [Ralstonia solanacearum]BCN04390.1 ABC transporter substrate-binding protein [Ralstonia solanacearum]
MNPRPLLRALIRTVAACVLAGAAATPLAARADDLRIGLAADVTSMDPHWNNAGPNNAMALHIFESLVFLDKNGRYAPGLATAWKAVDANTWEIKLRPGVKWSDGTPFTGEDVKASIERPARLTNSPGPFTSYTKSITGVQIVDPLTVRLKLSIPNYASIPNDLNSLPIIPKKVANATQADFDAGRAMIGTGPFLFDHFTRGQEIVLKKNPSYWGHAPLWDKVTFKIITDNAARTAALLAGDVDVVEAVPAADVPRIRQNKAFHLEQQVSWRTLFWQMDQSRDASPFITDRAGKPLAKNPFKDRRVREAVALAINRDAIVTRVLEGQGVVASSIVSPQIFGHPGGKPIPYDPEGAKKLLAQAGYPDGFGLTLHATNNRYLNDAQVAQTTAQLLTRVGIQTKVETLPVAAYFSRARQGEFSFMMLGWGSVAADVALRSILGTPNPQTGYGTWNWGRYSNPELDKLVQASLSTVSGDQAHEQAAKAAARFAQNDYAIIASHHQLATWAMRKGIRYEARTDEWSLAHLFTRQ